MGKFFQFIINFLFINQSSNSISHTKFWSNVGHAVACVMFVWTVMHDKAGVDLWIVFGVLILGNATANRILTLRYGAKAETQETTNG